MPLYWIAWPVLMRATTSFMYYSNLYTRNRCKLEEGPSRSHEPVLMPHCVWTEVRSVISAVGACESHRKSQGIWCCFEVNHVKLRSSFGYFYNSCWFLVYCVNIMPISLTGGTWRESERVHLPANLPNTQLFWFFFWLVCWISCETQASQFHFSIVFHLLGGYFPFPFV